MTTTHEPDTYDVVVIGGGPAGENAADYAVRGSDRTAAVVEHELLGGECSYWACMPSKALLGPGAALAGAAGLPGASERLDGTTPDASAVLRWRDTVTHGRDDSSQVRWAAGAGIEVIRGHGRIVGEREVVVGERVAAGLTGRGAVIRFGAQIAAVDRPEPADTGYGHLHGGPARVTITDRVRADEVAVDEVLVAAGRRPSTTGLARPATTGSMSWWPRPRSQWPGRTW
ncbi:putative oxidoreductase [Gordonia rhizosphera NBRC 16068]|uniref:Putative oxidoreductase n=1 Tax=Gordonia rhizosphera NBRC 16068 TaxID=1108045 RepID=K6WBD8_9ACTN|nr:putative oxidoreductase [Gordonia rhizosphera NBRC 16068]